MSRQIHPDVEAKIYEMADGTPWEPNEYGLWCNSCGNLIAAPWNVEDGCVLPDNCPECGFPHD